MNGYRELMRRKLLEEVYNNLSPEDKRLFVKMTFEDRNWNEIMDAINRQGHELDEVHEKVRRQTWFSDFSSNIAGNAVWDGLVWLGSRLFRKL